MKKRCQPKFLKDIERKSPLTHVAVYTSLLYEDEHKKSRVLLYNNKADIIVFLNFLVA